MPIYEHLPGGVWNVPLLRQERVRFYGQTSRKRTQGVRSNWRSTDPQPKDNDDDNDDLIGGFRLEDVVRGGECKHGIFQTHKHTKNKQTNKKKTNRSRLR